jgi:hypothetical protein
MMGNVDIGGRGAGRLRRARPLLAAGAVTVLLAGCGTSGAGTAGPTLIKPLAATTSPGPSTPAVTATLPVATTVPPVTATTNPVPTTTSPGSQERSNPTTDLLPPPVDGKFHSSVQEVPLAVLDRSTWAFGCPVTPEQLRYVTVSFTGFDGRAHTGEMLVNRSAAGGVVTVFRKLFAAGWPIEQMRIVTAADLNGTGAGDVNNTSAFTCRAVTGSQATWSQHAYGLAIDVNPFQNPYLSGSSIIPSAAGAYRDRSPARPGLNTPGSPPVKAFRALGWGWGGTYTSKKDYMHFSANGG